MSEPVGLVAKATRHDAKQRDLAAAGLPTDDALNAMIRSTFGRTSRFKETEDDGEALHVPEPDRMNGTVTTETRKACGYCKRRDGTHTSGCHTQRRGEDCKVCARVHPERCHWHGGPSHSTSFRGTGKREPKRASNGHVTGGAKPSPKGALAWFDYEIRRLEVRLAELRQARGMVEGR